LIAPSRRERVIEHHALKRRRRPRQDNWDFEATGSAVPPSGGVQAMWFSNAQAAIGEIPASLFEMLPVARTLRQGVREVSDQFQYSWALTMEREHALFYASFRQSFAIEAVTAIDRTTFIMKHAAKFPVVVPGTLRNPEAWITSTGQNDSAQQQ
jgi:hypothetical protein